MKSRPSEKPAKKKTKSTTAAKPAKKAVKKSARTAAKKTTVAKKNKTAAKKTTPPKVAAESPPPEPVEVQPEPPPPPEPVDPPVASPQASDQEIGEESSPPAASPVFVKHNLVGPDGSVRPGWEMWIGDHCFGRADSKDLLLASFERLQSPPSSFHWREVRNRMPIRGRAKRPAVSQEAEPEADHDDEILDDLSDVEETPDVS